MVRDAEGRSVDFGRTADDYDRHRPGFPASFTRCLLERGWISPGQRALDLGTGTGTVALGLARSGLDVVGVDPSEELLERARARAAASELGVRFARGTAEGTGEPDATFDLVSAGQCWWWFDADRALAEARRVLLPRGRLLIASYCYVPLPGSLAAETEELILAHNPRWAMAGISGIFEQHVRDLDRAGFNEVASMSWMETEVFSHGAWRGRVRACNGVGAVLDAEAVARFDTELSQLLAARYPDPVAVPHRVFLATGRR